MTGDEFERLVHRRIEEFGTSIVDVLQRLPNDRPDAWRPRVSEVVERWRRAGAQLTADSEASLFRMIDERAAFRRSQLAFADGGATNGSDAAPTMDSGSPSSSGAPQAPKLEEINPADIATGKVHYVRFKHSLRSGEMFYFTVDGTQWFKCPYRLAVWQGKQYVDVRQAVPYNPTGFQRYLLSHEGALSDPGWRAILERYAERFGYDAEQQVLRDLATLNVEENVKAQASTFMWALLIGMASSGAGKLLGKLASKLRDKFGDKVGKEISADLRQLQAEAESIHKDAVKAGPEALQQRAEKLKQRINELADKAEGDASEDIRKAADKLDEDLRKATKDQPGGAGAATSSPPATTTGGSSPTEVKAPGAKAPIPAEPPSRPPPGVLQTGDHTIDRRTSEALGMEPERVKRAIEKMKRSERRPASDHNHKIMDNGDVVDAKTGRVLGNLHDY